MNAVSCASVIPRQCEHRAVPVPVLPCRGCCLAASWCQAAWCPTSVLAAWARGRAAPEPTARNLQVNAIFSGAIRRELVSARPTAPEVGQSVPSLCAGKRPGFVYARHQMGSNYECDKRVIWQTLRGPAAA